MNERIARELFEVEAVLDDLHPELRDERPADWLRRALRVREARAEAAEQQAREWEAAARDLFANAGHASNPRTYSLLERQTVAGKAAKS